MMSVVKKALFALLVIASLFVLVGFLLPATAHVERTATIDAPRVMVFTLLNGFRSFNDWSPWFERDPDARYTYEGPDFGVGARMAWESDTPEVGSGSQEVIASEPYGLVRSSLDFGTEGTAIAFFNLEPVESGTRVTWGFDTDFGDNLIERYFGLMFDRWLGADYEAGLSRLKDLAEGLPRADWSDLEIDIVEVEPVPIAYVSGSSAWEADRIGAALGGAYAEVTRFLRRNRLQQAGPPVSITTAADDSEWHFDAGIAMSVMPVREIAADSPVQVRETYGGSAVRAVHVGPYTGISESWEKTAAFVAAHRLVAAGERWEEYVSDPGDTPEAELITHLFFPVE